MPKVTTTPTSEEWLERELERLEAMPCLCEPCRECTNRGCDECDGLGVAVYCERCEQINEVEMSIQQARKRAEQL